MTNTHQSNVKTIDESESTRAARDAALAVLYVELALRGWQERQERQRGYRITAQRTQPLTLDGQISQAEDDLTNNDERVAVVRRSESRQERTDKYGR